MHIASLVQILHLTPLQKMIDIVTIEQNTLSNR